MRTLPYVIVALVIVAGVVIYYLLRAPGQDAKVTLGGITVGGASGDEVSFDALGGASSFPV